MDMSIQELWSRALESIRGKLSKPSFETWLMSTKAVDYDDDTLVISAPNDFTRDWLASHYVDLIRDTLRRSPARKSRSGSSTPRLWKGGTKGCRSRRRNRP